MNQPTMAPVKIWIIGIEQQRRYNMEKDYVWVVIIRELAYAMQKAVMVLPLQELTLSYQQWRCRGQSWQQ